MSKEALKLALDALDVVKLHYTQNRHVNEAITAIKEALAQTEQEPVALKWQQAPVKTQWGDEMVVASVAIDKDHTVCLYCERDQTSKVDAMFAQRTWVDLTDDEVVHLKMLGRDLEFVSMTALRRFARDIQQTSKEKNT